MNARTKGIIIGGLLGGVLSIIPLVNMGNCLCCLWVILGGAVAAAIHVKGSDLPVGLGDGTITGLLAAIPMLLIYVVIGLPLNFVLGQLQQKLMAQMIGNFLGDPSLAHQIEMQSHQPIGQQLLGMAIGVVIYAVLCIGFSTLGGLIGAAILGDRDPGPPEGYGQYPPAGPPGGYPGQGYPPE